MTYPAATFSAVSAIAGAAAAAANATLTCSTGVGSVKCTLDGMQDTGIGNGTVANVTLAVASNASAGSVAVGIATPVAVGPNGSQIPAASLGGAVTVQTVSGLSCNSPVASPGSSACTVTLSSAALAGGTIVNLSSNNTNVTVPASITVAAGQTTGTFTATVLTVSSGFAATLTGSLGSSSKTFGLQVTVSTWTISGTLSPAVSGVSVALTGAATQTVTTNASGAYTFSGLANGAYTVTPTLSGYTFTPVSQAVTVNGANQSAVNFSDVMQTWTISGTVSPAVSGVSVALTGAATQTATTNASGAYTFSGLKNGAYTVTPTLSGYTFTPVSQAVTVNGANQSAVNFSDVAQTWTISGTVSPAVSGVSVALTGAATQTVTTNASGAYTFSGLANGAYTVTPTLSGYTFTPVPQAVTVNGANQSAVNFSDVMQTWTISGTVSPAVAGISVALIGAATQTALTNASGAYTFSGLKNGAYTVTPTLSGYTFTPTSQAVTLNGANQSTINFTDVQKQQNYVPPTLDVQISTDQKRASTTIASGTFSTASGNELLLAFVSTDSSTATVKSVSCGGLTWVLVKRTNVQEGTSEIWRAFAAQRLTNVKATVTLAQQAASSLTIASFVGIDASGTNGSGAIGAAGTGNGNSSPSASLTTTRTDSLVYGVGNDSKAGAAPVTLPGQSLVHQFSATNPGNFWVQRVTNPVPQSGTAITFGDSSPTKGSYNLTVVEILAAPPASGTNMSLVRAQPANGANVPVPGLSAGRPVTLYHPATGAMGDVCSPGGLVSLSGANFTSQAPQIVKPGQLPGHLAGVQVKVNGHAAPLLFASESRINFLCPGLPVGSALEVTVQGENGAIQTPAQSSMAAAVPGIFTVDESKQGVIQIAATNELAMTQKDGIRSRPAKQGETLNIYATGLGPVASDTPAAGSAPAASQSRPAYPVRVAIGDTHVDPAFVRPVPESPGVFEIGLTLPDSRPTGAAVPVQIEVTLPDKTTVASNVVTVAIE